MGGWEGDPDEQNEQRAQTNAIPFRTCSFVGEPSTLTMHTKRSMAFSAANSGFPNRSSAITQPTDHKSMTQHDTQKKHPSNSCMTGGQEEAMKVSKTETQTTQTQKTCDIPTVHVYCVASRMSSGAR